MRPLLSTLVLLSTFQILTAAEDTSALVDKVVDAYGGRAALEKLVAFREEGEVHAAIRVGSSGQIVRTFARGSKLAIQIGEAPKYSEVRMLNGAQGWRNGKEVTGVSFEAMVLQAVRLDLPWQLVLHKKELVEKPAVERDGKQLRVLEIHFESGLLVSAGIEPATGHILFSSGTTKTSPMTFETDYDDFRKVDGALFAFKETNQAQGTKTAETVLSKIAILKRASDDAFKP